jgi:periplasmic protein TonB
MSAAAPALYRVYDLPWTTGEAERERLRKIMRVSFGALLVLSLVMSFLPVPSRDADAPQEIPRRLARLVVERQAPPPPPPAPVVREEPVEPPPVIEPERVVEQRRVEPEPVVENEPPPPPVDTTAQARERARGAGVLQFASQLSALRTNADATADRLERTGTTVGAGTEAAAVNERSLITSRVGTASGGINTASLSRNTGGGGLAARTTTVVESPVEGFGEAGGAPQRSGTSDRGSRSREEIERVFDANKGRIFTLYNRALRENPALQGKVVLRLTITADGRVTFCEIVSSELDDPELERGLVQRVLQFQFEARDDVEPITTTKPIDFFPA